MRFAALFAGVVASAGCIIPWATPPIRGEVGATTRVAREARGADIQAAIGTHLASASTNERIPVDVGVGYLYDGSDGGSHGGYLDGALFVDRFWHGRTALGMRGEVRSTPMGIGYAGKLRLDFELAGAVDQPFEADGNCGSSSGHHYGTSGVGVFVETGRAWLPGDDAWIATAGLTVRLPGTAGVWVGIPGCD
ncbi:MAG TPA: hypothetical protein VIU61_25660 [Kofleriaceae bacterium]